VVAADCIYHKDPSPLLSSLAAVSSPDTRVYMGFQEHVAEAVEAFSDVAPKYFHCREVSRARLRQLLPADMYRPDLHIVEMRRRLPGEPARSFHIEAVRLASLFDRSSDGEQTACSSSDDEW
jgi:hypothetical protein